MNAPRETDWTLTFATTGAAAVVAVGDVTDAGAADDAVPEAGASDGADVSDGDGRSGGAGVFATTGGAGGRENRTRASRACGGLSRRSVG